MYDTPVSLYALNKHSDLAHIIFATQFLFGIQCTEKEKKEKLNKIIITHYAKCVLCNLYSLFVLTHRRFEPEACEMLKKKHLVTNLIHSYIEFEMEYAETLTILCVLKYYDCSFISLGFISI